VPVDATAATESLLPSTPSHHVLGERYEILGLLGSGGMGNVYKARDLELDELCALKVLHPEIAGAQGVIEGFRREVKLARRVTHPNVARVFDIGERGGEKILTMELIDGEPLSALLAREGRLLLARVVAVLRRAALPSQTAEPSVAVGAPSASRPDLHRFGDVAVDLQTREVTRDGSPVKLTHLEFELLAHFVKNPREVFTRERLMREVWAIGSGSRRTVDNFVAQLRGKLERDPDAPLHLVTVRGTGYRFDP